MLSLEPYWRGHKSARRSLKVSFLLYEKQKMWNNFFLWWCRLCIERGCNVWTDTGRDLCGTAGSIWVHIVRRMANGFTDMCFRCIELAQTELNEGRSVISGWIWSYISVSDVQESPIWTPKELVWMEEMSFPLGTQQGKADGKYQQLKGNRNG